MFAITVKLNEKGKKVCGVNTKVILVNGNFKPNTEEINETIGEYSLVQAESGAHDEYDETSSKYSKKIKRSSR